MHTVTILDCEKNSSLSLTDKLREQYKGSHDLILHHEWMNDFLAAKLTEEQFRRLISQQAYINDRLVSKIINFTLNRKTKNYDHLRKIANFLLNEAFGDLKLLDNTYIRALKVSIHTKEYNDYLKGIWQKHSYINKLITLYPIVWIHSEISKRLIKNSNHFITNKEWLTRVNHSNSHEILEVLSHLMDEEAQFIGSSEQLDLENLLSRIYQFELLLRNEAYQININKYQPKNH